MLDYQYAAGFFDGEGTVHIDVIAPRGDRNYDHYLLRVKITNTHQGIVRRFRARWGGGVSALRKKAGHKQAWYWYIASKKAARFLEDILPYLLVKRRAARLGLRLARMTKMGGRHVKLSARSLSARRRIYEELRRVNMRGDRMVKV